MNAKVAGRMRVALLTIGALTARSADAATLTPGIYNVYAQITNYTFTQSNKCASGSVPDASETEVTGAQGFIEVFQLTYHGPGKAATAMVPVPYFNGGSGPRVALLTLPPIPAGTNTEWKGMYTEVLQPDNFAFPQQAFSAILTVTSAHSFVGFVTFNGFVLGAAPDQPACNFSLQYVATFISPAD